jgi:hypothetical protein
MTVPKQHTGILRGGVQLGPLGTKRPIVPAPDDYNDGKLVEWRVAGETKYSEKTCPSSALSTTNPTCLPGREPLPPRWEASD